jgi:hypothetical protein
MKQYFMQLNSFPSLRSEITGESGQQRSIKFFETFSMGIFHRK